MVLRKILCCSPFLSSVSAPDGILLSIRWFVRVKVIPINTNNIPHKSESFRHFLGLLQPKKPVFPEKLPIFAARLISNSDYLNNVVNWTQSKPSLLKGKYVPANIDISIGLLL